MTDPEWIEAALREAATRVEVRREPGIVAELRQANAAAVRAWRSGVLDLVALLDVLDRNLKRARAAAAR